MFSVFRASSFEKLEFSVSANFQTAGSITNQVSSLLGAGATIIVLIYVAGKSIFNKFLDIVLLLLFFGVGLISFSRGGVISGLCAILLILLFPRVKKNKRNRGPLDIEVQNISPLSIIMIMGVFAISFFVINSISNNYLYYRYMGKTEREIRTGFSKDFNANKFTSGRTNIMEGDIDIFLNNPALGVGVGNSAYYRIVDGKAYNIASHTESTRLLAEHGSLGLIMLIMIFIHPIFRAFNEKNNFQRLIIISLFTIAITVTFHNAMRTCITPVLFALTFLLVVPNNIDKSYFAVRKTSFFRRKKPLPNPLATPV
ncbi:O-antigen ligase family protein [Polluticaenibacter yanchengensis]|uniref:O-antigen ligase family protein n=1 Tax=Polluticaenibacter yanchengensis TaxID=3014562 RepID=A0ABT4UKN3_9BACT|nr:O-antigen ligase family protein [Chitinophagaceae bacterium LY-5]